jgi:asparagine synthase (glutamine-hydrolysing)
MCGLFGYASQAPHPDPARVAEQRDLLSHRGPDDAGLWFSDDRRVVLAHRRLSIIDLSASGRQPFSAASGQLHLILNGEIYNYRELKAELQSLGQQFRTATDTEVLLAAYAQWGTDCLAHLIGMFAFVLHDARNGVVFAARDRAGEKPLYLWRDGPSCWFASELKAFLRDPNAPRTLDLQSLDFYLAYGYVPGSRTLIKGFSKLEPGHAATFDVNTGALNVWRYWQLPQFAPEPISENERAEELDRLLAAAVRRQLVADVPLGILLSGGLDSSLITALAARAGNGPPKTFTVSFPGAGKYDEATHARLVARHLGTEHHELTAEPGTVDVLPKLAAQFDEPIADPSIVPTYLIARMIREHAKVALAGNGGDELFGGYHTYQWVLRQQQIGRLLPAGAARALGHWAEQSLQPGVRGRHYLSALGSSAAERVGKVNLYFDATARAALVPSLRAHASEPERFKGRLWEGQSVIQQLTRTDFDTYLPESVLLKDDRASMLASLEMRAPFLDPAVIEFAFRSVPDDERATLHGRKLLLRKLAARYLPPEFDVKRKQGFSVPVDQWLRGGWGDYFRTVLLSGETLFERSAIQPLFQQRRLAVQGNRLFNLTMLELWRRAHGITST